MNTYWVPREDNEQADMLSKSSHETWDFGIRRDIKLALFEHFFRPRLDIFASRRFHVYKDYYTCGPDTRAIRADSFSVATYPDYSYALPPPPLISNTNQDQVLRDTTPHKRVNFHRINPLEVWVALASVA